MQECIRKDITKDEIVPLAERMRKQGRFLVMIHGQINPAGQIEVSYEYAVDPVIESYHVTGESVLPTISHIYDVAAQWPEREINELFNVQFEGLDMTARLFLPEDMLEDQGKGHIMVTPLSELVEKNKVKGGSVI